MHFSGETSEHKYLSFYSATTTHLKQKEYMSFLRMHVVNNKTTAKLAVEKRADVFRSPTHTHTHTKRYKIHCFCFLVGRIKTKKQKQQKQQKPLLLSNGMFDVLDMNVIFWLELG